MLNPATKILLTRPHEQSMRFRDQLLTVGIPAGQIIVSPVMKIRGNDVTVNLATDEIVIFTSSNAIRFAPTPGRGHKAICVGQTTTDLALAAGYSAKFCGKNVEDLVDGIVSAGPFVHLRGAHTTASIVNKLAEKGMQAREQIIYSQDECRLNTDAEQALKGGTGLVLPLFSQRSAKILQGMKIDLSVHHGVAISHKVAKVCRTMGFQTVTVAKRPDAKAMIDTISERMTQQYG